MDAFVNVVKFYLIPGSLSFLVLAITAVALLLCWRPTHRLGRLLLIGVVGLYWIFSLPAFADALQRRGTRAQVDAAFRTLDRGGAAIVILGTGTDVYRHEAFELTVPMPQTVLNVLRGVELASRSASPIIVSGGRASGKGRSEARVMAALLGEQGVGADRLVLEEQSRTTHEQAAQVAALARRSGVRVVVLVSAPAHLRRAVAAFRAEGLEAVGCPAPFRSDDSGSRRWLPDLDGFGLAHDAVYEYVAFVYYATRGWVG